ncbi:hypothetical protein [Nostoc sp. ChiQUE01b]|uniref:hypothetical protein n=1 Tax=Nostoc sp. ChiQUE01b TaxID=3075376 RepID=UPI002AD2853C|nr:hypothetical protein [Nostoc sp. ChiQUE01b]MDZ8260609.1 hypothetical protein [Nostoc sp. ChiQUE01b]
MDNTPDFTAYGYTIVEELGNYYYEDRTLYLARNGHHNRLVVLKVYRFGFTDDEAEVAHMAEQERQTLQALKHPGIPICFDTFLVRDENNPNVGSITLVLEYKPGISLDKGFHLTLPQLESLNLQVLDILAYGQTLNLFHHALNEGDIVVDYLPQGKIQVSVLNFGKRREIVVIPKCEQKWQHDLKKLGAIVVRLLTGKVTSDFVLFQKHSSSVSRLVSSQFQDCVQRLLGDRQTGSFQDARQAYQQFEKTPVLSPVYPPRHIPYSALLGYFAISVMLCCIWFNGVQLSSGMQNFGRTITQIPLTITLGFIPGQALEVNVAYLLAGVLFGLGALLVIVCLCCFVLEGVFFGVVLIVLAALVLGLYWLVGFVVNLAITLTPIAIAGILVLSFYSFMVNCWVQMRREKFTVSYTGLTIMSGTLAAVAVTGTALSLLVWQQNLILFMLLGSITFPLWLYLLIYPANRYQADVARHQKALALVLKA